MQNVHIDTHGCYDDAVMQLWRRCVRYCHIRPSRRWKRTGSNDAVA
ncbi:MAG: hypothetical protein JWM42_1643 [Burkholderia sp.]|nr:hypothetical protein [Burkholderia sp.]